MKTSSKENIDRRVGMSIDTPKHCSDPKCCGNIKSLKLKYKFNPKASLETNGKYDEF